MVSTRLAAAAISMVVFAGGVTTAYLATPTMSATAVAAAPTSERAVTLSDDIAEGRTPVGVIDTNIARSAALNGSAASAASKATAAKATTKATAKAPTKASTKATTKATAKAATTTTKAATPTATAAAPTSTAGTNLARAAMWDRIAACESTSNWSINTGNGYYGGLQFSASTWRAYGGAAFAALPHQASRAEQITIANVVYDKRGGARFDWGCAVKLGIS